MKNCIFRIPSAYKKKKQIIVINQNKIKKNKPKRKLSKETEITKDTLTNKCTECDLKDIYN